MVISALAAALLRRLCDRSISARTANPRFGRGRTGARIVDLAAKTGSWPTPFVEASIHSLFCFEPDEVEEVFGTIQGVRLGLEQLSTCLRVSQDPSAADTLRYMLAILQLEKRFARRDDLLQIVHSRLKHTAYKAETSPAILMT